MVYFGSSFADSPVLTIAPQTAHQAIALGKAASTSIPAPVMPRAFPPDRVATTTRSRSTGAGRKRTREESEPDLTDADDSTPSVSSTSTPDNVWMSGNDMALFETEVAASSSQTEALSAAEAMRKTEIKTHMEMQHDQQLSGRSHKRRGQMAPVAAASSDTESTGCDASGSAEPAHVVVDDFTLQLGIGWRRISNDEHIQAAARGWARFIENHYPISNVVIRLQSKGLQSYLVEATEGYFLFDENLRHGRLVSTTGEHALQNLRSHPPVFEGPEILMAATQPTIAPRNSARVFGTLEMEMEVC
ncbi:hypothetical protein VUR80DRAFT_5767 [Thermomyces stellatus]